MKMGMTKIFRAGLMTAVVLTLGLAGCAGYVPGQKAYWDARVQELCEKDGGVQIFEKLRVSRDELALLGKANGIVDIPTKATALPNSPAYAEIKRTYLREANPTVTRAEVAIVRRRDQVVVARLISYSRFGGDLPGPWHPSSFGCPDQKKNLSDLKSLFVVDGHAR
jgi:hypothetical protein